MVQIFLALAAAALASAPNAGLPPLLTPAVQEELAEIRAAVPRWQSVSLRVWATGSSFDLSEPFWRVSLRGSLSSWGRFSFSGFAGGESVQWSADPSYGNDPSRGFIMTGGGTYLSVTGSRGSWRVWGSAGGRHQSYSLSAFAGGFSVWGLDGGSLNVSRFGDTLWVNGQADSARLSPRDLAALGAILSVLSAVPDRAAVASEGTVRASWKPYGLHGGPRRNRCVSALYALEDALSMSGARNQRKSCSWSYGLRADWESLTALEDSEQADEAVAAVWRTASMQRHMAGGDCVGYSEALDAILERLPVKNVRQMVSCQGGSGFISLSFDYLSEP